VTTQYETSKALDQAFVAALLLTPSAERAEAAVLEGISSSDFHCGSTEMLIRETVKFSILSDADVPDQPNHELAILPTELRQVALHRRQYRRCYVMRVLAGMTAEECSAFLHLDVDAIEESVLMAIRELAASKTDATDRHAPIQAVGGGKVHHARA
jgi:hypothetical protein